MDDWKDNKPQHHSVQAKPGGQRLIKQALSVNAKAIFKKRTKS